MTRFWNNLQNIECGLLENSYSCFRYIQINCFLLVEMFHRYSGLFDVKVFNGYMNCSHSSLCYLSVQRLLPLNYKSKNICIYRL